MAKIIGREVLVEGILRGLGVLHLGSGHTERRHVHSGERTGWDDMGTHSWRCEGLY